ncbi:MAG: flippase-like domain-containing protein [Chitinophagaceae bacterium]|nr:flippase-like domain-containing protein [Chitinophagaceae bacterium]
MRKQLINAVQYMLFLGLGIFLLWLSATHLSEENKAHLFEALKGARYWLIVPVMVLLLLSHYIRALRWNILIRPLGYRPAVRFTFIATLLGYFFNLFVPRLGEVMKCTILAKQEKIPADKLIGTMVTERAFDFLCLLLIFLITILIQFDLIHQFASGQINAVLYAENGELRIFRLLMSLAVVGLLIGVIYWLTRIFSHSKFMQSVKKILKGVWTGVSSIRHMENKWFFLLHTILIWSLYLISMRIGFYTMDAVTHLGFKAALAILSFGSIAMLATQGGIGAYQYTIQKLLPLYGVEEGPALGFGWVLWISQTGIVIIAGIVCLVLLPVLNQKKHEILPSNQA